MSGSSRLLLAASRAVWPANEVVHGAFSAVSTAAPAYSVPGILSSHILRSSPPASTSTSGCHRTFASHGSSSDKPDAHGPRWSFMLQQGYKLNPCNSPLHPAVKEGAVLDEEANETCVQVAYTPNSRCFGCGPASKEGLRLQSRRYPGGLVAALELDGRYCAFPGIVNGGIISTLMDCHGNWTAAIALMDRACLPKPPLTLTASIFITYKEPTPPHQPLILRSKVIEIKEISVPGTKAQVEVDISLFLQTATGGEHLVAHGTGIFKKQGALRAL